MAARTDSAGVDTENWQTRFDRGALLPLAKPYQRADGTLFFEGYAAKAGVYTYRRRDGTTFTELVDEDVLSESAGGLARLPVTREHPREDVTPQNYGELGVGDTDGEIVIEEGGYIRVKGALRKQDAIDDVVTKRRREMSAGYKAVIDPTPGVHPKFGRYDQRQVRRRYNHLALVQAGRHGPDVAIRTDADDGDDPAVCTVIIERRTDGAPNGARPHGVRMEQHLSLLAGLLVALGSDARFDSVEEALKNAIAAATKIRRDAAAREAELQGQVDTLTVDRDTQRTRADAAETAKTAAETAKAEEKRRADAADAEVAKLREAEQKRADAAEREQLDSLCKAHRVDPAKHATNAELKRALATAASPSLREDASDAVVDATVALLLQREREDQGEGDDGPGAGRFSGAQAWQGSGSSSRQDGGDGGQVRTKRNVMADRWSGRAVRGGE